MAGAGNAQFKTSLKDLKNKTADKVKDKTEKTTDKIEKTDKTKVASENVTDEPKYDPESATYRAFSTVRDELKSTRNVLKDENWKGNVEGKNDEATRYLDKVKLNLTKLENDPIESKKPYIKKYKKEYEEVEALRKTKFESYTADAEYDKKIEAYYMFATQGWEIRDKSLEPSYTGYYAMRSDFEAKRPEKFKSDYVQKRVTAVDNFFKVEVYKVVPELNTKVDKIFNSMHAKNSSGDEEYLLNAKNYLKELEEPIATIVYNKKYLLEDKSGIDAVQSKIDKEKAILDEYVNSGKYDAHVAKFKQQIIDKVRMGTPKMTNPKYETMARAAVNKGKASRVVLPSDVWFVKKTEYGFPLYKYLDVNIAVNFENKCWLAYGQIRKQYEGGGVYGAEYFEYWGLQDEMNCLNVNK